MYLIDTDVISEARKGPRANTGVHAFLTRVRADEAPVFLSAVTIGELRRGVELIRYRGDERQAKILESRLAAVVTDFDDYILPLDGEIAQVWGLLRLPHSENALDKQVAATAIIHGLTLVSRNERHYRLIGVDVLNPSRS